MRDAAAVTREAEAETVPDPPAPDGADAAIGTEKAQGMAARYLPNCVVLLAAVAFGRGSKAKLHTRVVAVGLLVKIAVGGAEEVPSLDDG